jgi:hypothetical protein
MKIPFSHRSQNAVRLAIGTSVLMVAYANAGMVTDRHGNVGYDTAAECDAAVAAGTAKFYQPFTQQPPLKRGSETRVQAMRLADLTGARETAERLGYEASAYSKGACDVGVGRSGGRDGASGELVGKWIPFSPEMSVNAYFNSQGLLVRATMQQCDNHFGKELPRPVSSQRVASNSECFANVLIPARFETKTEQVVKVPATQRVDTVPPTFKTVTEQVMVSPAFKKQIPVPATYKTIEEEVVVKPASFREEPVPATYKSVTEQVLVKPESKRVEVIPATYKKVTETVIASPERKELVVVPAVYGEREETVVVQAASTRAVTVPPTYKTETERVLVQAESVRYEPIELPLRTVREEMVRSEASSRLEVAPSKLRTVTERVLVKEASTRLVPVPAVYETVTERVKVADARREWKRGSAWVGQAIDIRPLRTFRPGPDGKFTGFDVENRVVNADNSQLDDDVMCLVEVPARYETLTRQVLKTPATVREETVAAEYANVQRQVIDQQADSREIQIPATYQTVTRRELDMEKMRKMGYRFDARDILVAMPSGERILRADEVKGTLAAAAQNKKPADADDVPAYVREIRTPAEYKTITRRVIDQPAQIRTVEVPAVTKSVMARVVLNPARTEERLIPAVARTVVREVVDQPATSREVMEPAVYKTVSREVVDQPATTRRIPVPEVRQKMSRRVVDQPATVREVEVPAVYKTVTRQVVDQAASMRAIDVPAQYENVSYQIKVADARTERRSILCETNATPAKIREIQAALNKAGFNPGPLDGVLRAQTMQAVNRYQQAKGLPVDGFLNLETVKTLGVSPN